MEQKKTLWIVLSSGIFLLVVILTAILFFKKDSGASKNSSSAWVSPSISDIRVNPSSTPESSSSELPKEDEQLSLVNTDQTAEGPVEPTVDGKYLGENALTADEATVNADKATVNADTVYVSGTTLQLNTINSNTVTPINEAAENAINKTNEARGTASSSAVSENSSKKTTETTTASNTGSKKNTSSGSSTSTSASTSASTSKKSSASSKSSSKSSGSGNTAAPASTPVPSFWVQAASYTTKKNADEARAALEASSLPCEVFTYKDPNTDKLYYRVRVGPYTTKSEAEYWQAKISAMDYFKGSSSYVTNAAAKAQN